MYVDGIEATKKQYTQLHKNRAATLVLQQQNAKCITKVIYRNVYTVQASMLSN